MKNDKCFLRPVIYAITSILLGVSPCILQGVYASVIVDSIADEVAADGFCTLREAIQAVNTNSIVNECDGTDTNVIEIAVSPIVLTSALPALGSMIIQGNNHEVSGNLAVRVFDLSAGAQVTIEDLTISNGNAGAGMGGGIRVTNAELILNRCVITRNRAFAGGGVRSFGSNAIVEINDCLIQHNQTPNEGGGGINNDAGSSMTVTRSTIADNQGLYAGGIANYNGAAMLIRNSTISGNRCAADVSAGGIENFGSGSSLTIQSSSIANNFCDGSTSAGGIFNNATAPELGNTLVAGNFNISGREDLSGSFSSNGHNLIGNGTGSSGFSDGVNNDQVGSASNPIDPLLSELDHNGGPTPTHALLSPSPAIDAGSNASAPLVDQRGIGRPQGLQIDIGAYEARRFSMVIQGAGNGTGQIAGDDLDCFIDRDQTSGDCTAEHIELDEVTLSAIAGSGSQFVGWGGSCTGTESAITLLMDSHQACIATFDSVEDQIFGDRFEPES